MVSDTAVERAMASLAHFQTDGDSSSFAATKAYKGRDDVAYALSQLPLFTPRPIKVIVIGAGFSGLSFAKAVASGQLKAVDLTIYEKNTDLGGTWFENRYPGCACDIPAHNYQFSWAPSPHWRSFYAGQKDILNYIEAVADQHDLRKYVKVCRKVTGAEWDELKQVWKVNVNRTDERQTVVSSPESREGETEDFTTEECDVLINCTGFFNNWKWPAISGRESFQGRLLHSAAWPADADEAIDGKTVALIGNGSSGIQILPGVIERVKKIVVHMRSPTWVTTGLAERFAGPGGSNLVFSKEQKDRWSQRPDEYLAYRKEVEQEMNSRFKLYIRGSTTQEAARKFSMKSMTEKLTRGGKEYLIQHLLPSFEVGCRRPTPGNGYLEALCSPKCEIVWGDVVAFMENGLRTGSGAECQVDTVICATGFDLSLAPRFPIIGKNRANLQENWKANPASYLSVTAEDMPNYFTYMGPSSPVGHGSLVSSIEFVTIYVCDLISKLQTQNYSSVCPKPGVAAAYQKHALSWLDRTVWSSDCSSTFKNGRKDGKLVSLHPGSRLHYFKLLSTPRHEDFDWTSLCSDPDLTFAWLANGFTLEEEDPSLGRDMTYFLNPSPYMKAVEPLWEAVKTEPSNGTGPFEKTVQPEETIAEIPQA